MFYQHFLIFSTNSLPQSITTNSPKKATQNQSTQRLAIEQHFLSPISTPLLMDRPKLASALNVDYRVSQKIERKKKEVALTNLEKLHQSRRVEKYNQTSVIVYRLEYRQCRFFSHFAFYRFCNLLSQLYCKLNSIFLFLIKNILATFFIFLFLIN